MALVHRHVMERALGRPLERSEIVMHRCDNPPCFRLDHLRLATQAVNNADCRAKGRHATARGEDHPNAKLDTAAVAMIRSSNDTDGLLAARFGVSRTLIRKVRANEIWKGRR